MSGIAAYKENSVVTQPQGRVVVLLYEGAIKFLKQAQDDLAAGDLKGKGEKIGRALDIINELDAALNIEEGGEVAQNLRKLYDFMYNHLLQANLKKNSKMVQDVIDCLDDLLKGWKAIATG